MANMKYFAGDIELTNVWHDGTFTKARNFSGLNEAGVRVIAERMVEYKSQPSKHVCDARCLNATGRIMKCECSCGGKNHGRGSFNCTAD